MAFAKLYLIKKNNPAVKEARKMSPKQNTSQSLLKR